MAKRIDLRDLKGELEKIQARGAAAKVELVIADADGDGDQDVALVVDGVTVGRLELSTILDGLRRLFERIGKAIRKAVKK